MEYVDACPHGTHDLSAVRQKTSLLTKRFVESAVCGAPLNYGTILINGKIRPNFSAVDFPDFYLLDTMGVGTALTVDSGHFFARTGVSAIFNNQK